MKKITLKTETEQQIAKQLSEAILPIAYIAKKHKLKVRTLWNLIHRSSKLSKSYQVRVDKKSR